MPRLTGSRRILARSLFFSWARAGDQNPYPRHASLEQSEQHGRTLANAVEAAPQVTIQRSVDGPSRSALGDVEFAYANISRADLERRANSRITMTSRVPRSC